ncbi:MAG: hypothetical protein AB1601_15520 [Planctomycetota bacterium]
MWREVRNGKSSRCGCMRFGGVLGVAAAVVAVGVVAWVAYADGGSCGSELPILVNLDETATPPAPDPDPTDSVVVTDDPQEFQDLVALHASLNDLGGVAVISSSPSVYPLPADIQVWATIYSQETLDFWNQTAYTPAFLQGVVVPEVPGIEDAAFDLDVIAPDADAILQHPKLRVRCSDGAAAVVFMVPTGIASANSCIEDGCNAGPWWRRKIPFTEVRVCCGVQRAICHVVRRLLPSPLGQIGCGDCDQCYHDCQECRVSNPCHSCDRCGGSLILCNWFGQC